MNVFSPTIINEVGANCVAIVYTHCYLWCRQCVCTNTNTLNVKQRKIKRNDICGQQQTKLITLIHTFNISNITWIFVARKNMFRGQNSQVRLINWKILLAHVLAFDVESKIYRICMVCWFFRSMTVEVVNGKASATM